VLQIRFTFYEFGGAQDSPIPVHDLAEDAGFQKN
jgi:hypothetical protein